MLKILVVDDDKDSRDLLKMSLGDQYDVDIAVDGVNAVSILSDKSYDVVICDLVMNNLDGFDVLKQVKKLSVDTMFILITGFGTVDIAIKAIQEGAYEYVCKPFKMNQIKAMLRQIEKRLTSRDEGSEVGGARQSDMIGNSPVFLEVVKNMARIASSDIPVLISGESGTGKEVFARSIHRHSMRNNKPFVAINCTAIPASLLESELFGYEKGAFTGATSSKPGYFEQANTGTLFIDEIGDLNLDMQVKLLRVLEEKKVRRVGGSRMISLNVRLLFATNAQLPAKVQAGEFRSDLYYRLKVAELQLPSLRERKEDIVPLAQYFLTKYENDVGRELMLNKDTVQLLNDYDFPGNIRELENMIRNAMLQGKNTGVILPSDLGIEEKAKPKPAEITKEDILRVLEEVGNRRILAAKKMNVSRATFYRLLNKYGIEKS